MLQNKERKPKRCVIPGCKNLGRVQKPCASNPHTIYSNRCGSCADHMYYVKNKEKMSAKYKAYYLKYKKQISKRNNQHIKIKKTDLTGYLERYYTSFKSRLSKYQQTRTIVLKDMFMAWSLNHPVYLKLFKQWGLSGYSRRLTPSITKIDTRLDYTINNLQWVTCSQNQSFNKAQQSLKAKSHVYKLLGVE